ncbi:FlxA-like family protein [Corynebacterium macclintockiae]|uniref:FlxA-like family protein n=1 Tax=Corynebacterium macclintockiae TaxID=2913501 RepID=UPI003EBB8F99
MTNNRKRLEQLQEQAKQLQEQIEQLKAEEAREAKQPRDNLLGRWARHEKYGHVLIACQHADERGWLFIASPDDGFPDGANGRYANQRELTFPEQTTRPQDVPVGEAWLIDADDGDDSITNTPAVKESTSLWIAGENNNGDENAWANHEVTLITPLIPARPQDTPETVTTEEEYGALPEGSVVAEPGENPWVHLPFRWLQEGATTDDVMLAGTARHVLRRGWGE